MSGWLPITTRNRVALGLAFAALVMFVVWNCLPTPDPFTRKQDGIGADFWLQVLSKENYLYCIKLPDINCFLWIAAHIALILNALVTLALIPFWKILHASSFLRLPLAVVNLLGFAVTLYFLLSNDPFVDPYLLIDSQLVAWGMFTLSAALFTFRNELALREERNRPMAG